MLIFLFQNYAVIFSAYKFTSMFHKRRERRESEKRIRYRAERNIKTLDVRLIIFIRKSKNTEVPKQNPAD